MPDLDVNIHAPARLKLMTTLTAVSEAEFAVLRDSLQVSDSVLSKHLAALVSIHYIKTRKGVRLGRRTTWISLTTTGRTALATHVEALRELIAGVPSRPRSRPDSQSTGAANGQPESTVTDSRPCQG
jgi:DNA-binding MarR family transcriptional regulator